MPYYHVIIALKSRPNRDTLGIDLTEKRLLEEIVIPIDDGRKFSCGYELIEISDVKTMRITKTDEQISKHLKLDMAFPEQLYIEYWKVASNAEDVTAKYISNFQNQEEPKTKNTRLSKDIFIVHGRDHKPVKELKKMLLGFGLNPIVLHEQPSGSRTLIESSKNTLM